MCHTQQCLMANCSTTEHQQWRRFGLQQLHTGTGGHPADGSVMTADVVWTACQKNVAGLQPDRMASWRSVSDTRLSPACTNTLRGFHPSSRAISFVISLGHTIYDRFISRKPGTLFPNQTDNVTFYRSVSMILQSGYFYTYFYIHERPNTITQVT